MEVLLGLQGLFLPCGMALRKQCSLISALPPPQWCSRPLAQTSPHPSSATLVGFWDEGWLYRLEALLEGMLAGMWSPQFPSRVTGVGHTGHQEWLDREGSASLEVTRAEGNCWEQ